MTFPVFQTALRQCVGPIEARKFKSPSTGDFLYSRFSFNIVLISHLIATSFICFQFVDP